MYSTWTNDIPGRGGGSTSHQEWAIQIWGRRSARGGPRKQNLLYPRELAIFSLSFSNPLLHLLFHCPLPNAPFSSSQTPDYSLDGIVARTCAQQQPGVRKRPHLKPCKKHSKNTKLWMHVTVCVFPGPMSEGQGFGASNSSSHHLINFGHQRLKLRGPLNVKGY